MDAYYGILGAGLILTIVIWWGIRRARKPKLVDTPRPNRVPYDQKTYRRR